MSLAGVDPQDQLQKALMAFSMIGVGEVLGGPIMGLIVDKIGSKVGVVCNCVTIVFACVISIVQI